MGNRAVITTKERELGVYLHWNGGRDTVEPLLRYCELQGYRSPTYDTYGWARLCQVIGNFFGGSLSVGIQPYTTDEAMNPWDNGVYIIDGWEIVERITWEDFEEQQDYDFDEMLHFIDERMPEHCRLGEYLNAEEIPTSQVQLGDMVYVSRCEKIPTPYEVVGFGTDEVINGSNRLNQPYVALYENGGDYSRNPNNYIDTEKCRIVPRKNKGQ